jgi:hypothetical protein
MMTTGLVAQVFLWRRRRFSDNLSPGPPPGDEAVSGHLRPSLTIITGRRSQPIAF